jgi:hypothetical protein
MFIANGCPESLGLTCVFVSYTKLLVRALRLSTYPILLQKAIDANEFCKKKPGFLRLAIKKATACR